MSAFDRRSFLRSSLPLVAPAWPWGAAAQAAGAPAPRPSLGINLAGIADWGTELPFVDVFRQSRPWISQRPNAGWGQGPALALDEGGWVKALEPDCWAETPMCSADGGLYPAGTWLVTYTGKGEIEFWGGARVIDRGNGRLSIETNPAKGPIWCRLRKTDPKDPVRAIRILRPGADASTPPNAFAPDFLRRWSGVSCVRFMDWMNTNHTTPARWADRPLPTDASFMPKGVPVEVMVDLANRLETMPWFCMPHTADEDYVRRFAEQVKRQLAPGLKVAIEYSNEVWNGMFPQARHAQAEAARLRISPATYTARRSLEMFRIWEQVFGGAERLVRMLPSQAGHRGLSEQIVKADNAFRSADALAIAPYLSFNIATQGHGTPAAEVERWSLDQLFEHLETKALPQCVDWMKQHKTLADAHGLRLVAYEGGQHLVGILGAENNDKLTRLMHQANADPRMGRLYERYFEAWTAAGGDLHCHFSSVAQWTKWGSWGLLRHAGEDPTQSPKFMATMNWARQRGQKVTLPS